MSSTSMTLMSTPSPVSMNVRFRVSRLPHVDSILVSQFEETSSLPVFLLPKIVDKSKVFPGIKDLPDHIRPNFRNEFIRFVIKRVANSESPWTNPDVPSIQAMYQLVYPAFPAQVRNSDAVYHPVSHFLIIDHQSLINQLKTITSLGVLRNHIAATAVTAVTGGKEWCPGLEHCKYIARKWSKYPANTHPVHPKFIQNFPSQFPCSVPRSVNGQYVHSVPGHVTVISPLGTPWEHFEISQRK